MRLIYFFILYIFCIISPLVKAQSKFSLTPGIYYNGAIFEEEVNGLGAIIGLEYKQRKDHFMALEFRTRFGYYSFDDGTKWTYNNDGLPVPPKNKDKARLEYKLFSPQISIVPRFHFYLDESLSLFLENEFATGLIIGTFTYGGQPYLKKSFRETVFSYNIGLGAEYKLKNWSLIGSLGYSTLNFRNKIREHQPQNYQGAIPNQNAGLVINLIFKLPL